MRMSSIKLLSGLGVLTASLLAGLPLGAEPPAASQPAGPRMEFVQQFRSEANNAGKMIEASPVRFSGEINTLQINGDYLYVSAKQNISWFKRDLPAGKLTLAGELPLKDTCNLAVAGGRLYATGGKSMTWYDLDGQTGKPVEKGAVDCPPSFPPLVSPDQKDLYVKPTEKQKDSDKVLWFHLGADGAPAPAGSVAGKGIGGGQVWMTSFTMSADGKFMYCADATGSAIACIERKPTGEISYKKGVELKLPDKPADFKGPYVNYTYPFVAVTPDGKWLYLSMLGYVGGVNFNALFKRDAETGDLTCVENSTEGYGKDHKQFYSKAMVLAFLPDSSGGYWANCERTVSAFTIDPSTGRQVWTGDFKDGQGTTATRMAFDSVNGLLYTAGGGTLFVIQTNKKAAP